MATTLTIDIGGTKCAVAITDDAGVHGLESWPTKGPTENLERAVSFYRKHLGAGGNPAVAVGVSFGGPVDYVTSTVKRSVHVSGWSGFDLGHGLVMSSNFPSRSITMPRWARSQSFITVATVSMTWFM